MITFNYYCTDCTCGAEPGKDKTFEMTLSEKEGKKKQVCPNFEGSKRSKAVVYLKLLGQKMSTGLLRFSGKTMTLDQKQAALKKRSSVDYEKNVKDRKHEMWKKTFGRGDEKPNK